VHSGKDRVGVADFLGGSLGPSTMVLAVLGQRRISHPAVGVHDGASGYGVGDEAAERVEYLRVWGPLNIAFGGRRYCLSVPCCRAVGGP
jgi:hypothetical protein